MNRFRERFGFVLLCALVAGAIGGCGAPEPAEPPAAGAAPPAEPASSAASSMIDAAKASGVYEVHGVTVQAADGELREIDGILRLHVKGESFSATFELDTIFPGPEASFPAKVAGWGQGMVVGDTMAGTISSSVVRSDVAGAPPPTRMLPVEELLVMSSSVARFTPKGTLQVELQNHPGIGQRYSPSVTVLEGKRVRPLRVEAPQS